MRKILSAAACALAIAAGASGCRSTVADPASLALPADTRASIVSARSVGTETVLVANPTGALVEIRESLSGSPNTSDVPQEDLENIFGIAPYEIISFVAFTSDPLGGLSEVVIVEPAPERVDHVREALIQYGVKRSEDFKNYDIMNAHAIASGAVVYNQGNYVVMLMLPDNDIGVEIIDRHIPR